MRARRASWLAAKVRRRPARRDGRRCRVPGRQQRVDRDQLQMAQPRQQLGEALLITRLAEVAEDAVQQRREQRARARVGRVREEHAGRMDGRAQVVGLRAQLADEGGVRRRRDRTASGGGGLRCSRAGRCCSAARRAAAVASEWPWSCVAASVCGGLRQPLAVVVQLLRSVAIVACAVGARARGRAAIRRSPRVRRPWARSGAGGGASRRRRRRAGCGPSWSPSRAVGRRAPAAVQAGGVGGGHAWRWVG